jgi:hypothetical protein
MDGYKIISVREHYEAFTLTGQFIVSGDTWADCYNNLVEVLYENALKQILQEV